MMRLNVCVRRALRWLAGSAALLGALLPVHPAAAWEPSKAVEFIVTTSGGT